MEWCRGTGRSGRASGERKPRAVGLATLRFSYGGHRSHSGGTRRQLQTLVRSTECWSCLENSGLWLDRLVLSSPQLTRPGLAPGSA